MIKQEVLKEEREQRGCESSDYFVLERGRMEMAAELVMKIRRE